jgi:hypothetical protein
MGQSYFVAVSVVFLVFLLVLGALVFLDFVVAAGVASSANTGIANEKMTIDANSIVSSFFMVSAYLLRFNQIR